MRANELSAKTRATWPTGLERFDALLHGGLPKGAITEFVGEKTNCGTASVIHALLRQAHETNQFIALIDGRDSFDPTTVEQDTLSRLLWIRCHNATEAMKCADILLRDRNLPLVILDLKINPAKELKKISGTIWYRLQRVIQQTPTAFLAITPRAMVSSAEIRLVLDNYFSLEDLERDPTELLEHRAAAHPAGSPQYLSAELAHERKTAEHLRQTA